MSVIVAELLQCLPAHAAESSSECAAALSDAHGAVMAMQRLLEAAAITLADALFNKAYLSDR